MVHINWRRIVLFFNLKYPYCDNDDNYCISNTLFCYRILSSMKLLKTISSANKIIINLKRFFAIFFLASKTHLLWQELSLYYFLQLIKRCSLSVRVIGDRKRQPLWQPRKPNDRMCERHCVTA